MLIEGVLSFTSLALFRVDFSYQYCIIKLLELEHMSKLKKIYNFVFIIFGVKKNI